MNASLWKFSISQSEPIGRARLSTSLAGLVPLRLVGVELKQLPSLSDSCLAEVPENGKAVYHVGPRVTKPHRAPDALATSNPTVL